VGVLELGRDLRLVHEGPRQVWVVRDRGLQTEDGDDLLETRRAQLGRTVFGAQARRLGFLEEDQLPELLSPGHLSFGGSGEAESSTHPGEGQENGPPGRASRGGATRIISPSGPPVARLRPPALVPRRPPALPGARRATRPP